MATLSDANTSFTGGLAGSTSIYQAPTATSPQAAVVSSTVRNTQPFTLH